LDRDIFAHYSGLDLGLELSGLGLGLGPLASRCLASLTSLLSSSRYTTCYGSCDDYITFRDIQMSHAVSKQFSITDENIKH